MQCALNVVNSCSVCSSASFLKERAPLWELWDGHGREEQGFSMLGRRIGGVLLISTVWLAVGSNAWHCRPFLWRFWKSSLPVWRTLCFYRIMVSIFTVVALFWRQLGPTSLLTQSASPFSPTTPSRLLIRFIWHQELQRENGLLKERLENLVGRSGTVTRMQKQNDGLEQTMQISFWGTVRRKVLQGRHRKWHRINSKLFAICSVQSFNNKFIQYDLTKWLCAFCSLPVCFVCAERCSSTVCDSFSCRLDG